MTELSRRYLLALASLGLVLPACAGSKTDPNDPSDVSDGDAPPRDTHLVARKVVGAKVDALIHMEEVRDHPLAPKVASMDAWGPAFDGTGIEPLRDVERAFVAAANARDKNSVLAVAEHTVDDQTVISAFDVLVARSGQRGMRLDDRYGVPSALVTIKGQTSVLLAVRPQMLVITSEAYGSAAVALKDTGGLPDKVGKASLVARAEEPNATLRAPNVPPIPPTIKHVDADVILKADGGAEVNVDAQSTDPEQAKTDAVVLTEEMDKATSMKISVIKIRAFRPMEFTAVGDRVKAKHSLSKSELTSIIGIAEMLAEKQGQ